MSIIQLLIDYRICEISYDPNRDLFDITEGCDENFFIKLSPDEMRQLFREIEELANG